RAGDARAHVRRAFDERGRLRPGAAAAEPAAPRVRRRLRARRRARPALPDEARADIRRERPAGYAVEAPRAGVPGAVQPRRPARAVAPVRLLAQSAGRAPARRQAV